MWLYPFQNKILKTALNRSEIEEMLLQNSFLSDEGYVRKAGHEKFFYGTVSKDEFDFETIEKKDKLAGFFSGSIRGVENDMFVFLSIKAFRYRRIFFLFLIFILICFGILVMQMSQYGLRAFSQEGAGILIVVSVLLLGYIMWTGRQLDHKMKSSVDFFRGMLQADVIKNDEVPVLFQN